MTVFSYLFLALQIALLLYGGYWLIISLFGFGKAERLPEREPEKRFLVLVPAHNEAEVIGSLVENLMNLDYPKELFEVCVIADNCTDKTADISRKLGAIVLEHTSLPGEKKGKPYAIKYAIDFISIDNFLTSEFDAIAIFDADNLVTTNYLREMNHHLLNGEKLIQCYLDSKNPNDNWITLGYATSYYFMNRSWQLAKYRLGLGNAIGGTGFCVDTGVIKEVGWTARSLTEDLEFTMQCLLKGIPTSWCHHARVYDEKPVKFKDSCVQRLRWARGHWDVCFKYAGRLFLRAFVKRDVRAFDGAVYLLNPAKILLEAATWIVGILMLKQDLFQIYPVWLWISLLIFSSIYTWIASGIDTNKKINKPKAIISAWALYYVYIPLFFWALITFKNTTWVKTKHSRNITMDAFTNEGITKNVQIAAVPSGSNTDTDFMNDLPSEAVS